MRWLNSMPWLLASTIAFAASLPSASSPALADPAPPGTAYEIFSKNTAFHITGDDKLTVFGVADPSVTGVVCTFTAPVKGGFKSALG